MKFRTKIFISFVSIAIVSSGLTGGLHFFRAKGVVFGLIEGEIRSLVNVIPVFLNIPWLKEAIEDGPSSKSYQEIKSQLVLATERVSRKENLVKVRNIFIGLPTGVPYRFKLIADGYPNPKESGSYGQIYDTSFDVTDPLNRTIITRKPYSTKYGVWYAGLSPIFDIDGRFVAFLVVEVDANQFTNIYTTNVTYLFAAFLISILLAFFVSAVLAQLMTRSLDRIQRGLGTIEKKEGGYEPIQLESGDEFGNLAMSINFMLEGLGERDRLKVGFSKYVSDYVLNQVMKSDRHFLEGERKKITVLFSDIRHFTALSEQLPAEDIVSILNNYFELMIEVIFKHHGTLNKFMGDGLMVMFGAPLSDEEQEHHAIEAALEMQFKLKQFNYELRKQGKPEIAIGIGVHTGLAVVGNIGSSKRMEYTAIGDTVNTASRIEQLTKKYEEEIILSETTFMATKGQFVFKNLGREQLKGRKEEIGIYCIPSSSYQNE